MTMDSLTATSLEFSSPELLWMTLLAVPIFLLGRRTPGRLRFSSLSLLPATAATWRVRLVLLPDILIALATAAIGVALAGPRIGDQDTRTKREGIAIMMVIDTSGSMQALDLSDDDGERTRLDAVKDVFDSFVRGGDGLDGREDDAVGLVSFAGFADTACPLTLDHDNLSVIAKGLEIVTARAEDGTAIGDGLGLAVERLRDSKAKSKIVILLTDGVNNAGEESPLAAAQLAATLGVKVYAIGAGSDGLAPVRVQDPFTGQTVLRPMRVEIDEQTLQKIAAATGGEYFRATDAEALRRVYAQIDRLERVELKERRFRRYHEYFRHFLGLAMLLGTMAFVLRFTVWRRLPG